MRCPLCNDSQLRLAQRQGIELDCRFDLRGAWLDRGELDKIIERSAPDVAPQRVPEPRGYDDDRGYRRRQHGGGDGKHGYRRKSWLHELFD